MKLLWPAVTIIALSAASVSAFALTDADRYGEMANPAAAMRTIVVQPNARWVNVTHGEIVKFVVNGREFAWDFDGLLSNFKLSVIDPQDGNAENVQVYIERSYQNLLP